MGSRQRSTHTTPTPTPTRTLYHPHNDRLICSLEINRAPQQHTVHTQHTHAHITHVNYLMR